MQQIHIRGGGRTERKVGENNRKSFKSVIEKIDPNLNNVGLLKDVTVEDILKDTSLLQLN